MMITASPFISQPNPTGYRLVEIKTVPLAYISIVIVLSLRVVSTRRVEPSVNLCAQIKLSALIASDLTLFLGVITVENPVGLEQSLRSLKLKPDQERMIAPEPEETRDAPAPAPAPQTVALLRHGIDYGYSYDR